jgi:hypothetical protein
MTSPDCSTSGARLNEAWRRLFCWIRVRRTGDVNGGVIFLLLESVVSTWEQPLTLALRRRYPVVLTFGRVMDGSAR